MGGINQIPQSFIRIFFRGDGGLHGFQGEQWGNQPSLTELKGGLKKIDCRLREGGVGGGNQSNTTELYKDIGKCHR